MFYNFPKTGSVMHVVVTLDTWHSIAFNDCTQLYVIIRVFLGGTPRGFTKKSKKGGSRTAEWCQREVSNEQ